jgi:hypothetical protein
VFFFKEEKKEKKKKDLFLLVTLEPICSTTPTISCPGVIGRELTGTKSILIPSPMSRNLSKRERKGLKKKIINR